MPETPNSVAGKPGLDPTLPDVALILGGVERRLVFDFNAIVHAEKVTGLNLIKAMVSELDATRTRGLLWAALLKEHAELTLEEVGGWLHPRNLSVVRDALIATWFGSIPEPDAEAKAKGEDQAQATKAA